MEYVYTAIFKANEDGSFTITFPDLPGCISEGKNLANALYMAERALTQRIEYSIDKGMILPTPTDITNIEIEKGNVATLIRAGVRDTRAIRRTVSLPKWMDEQADAAGLSLSRVLQDALEARL